jgi:hypothetical protein
VKAASLLNAHRAGAQSVTTHNDESNTPIIPANKAPGMVPDVGYWSASRSVKAYQRRRARLHVHAEMHL